VRPVGPALRLSAPAARRFLVRVLGLARPHRSVAAALAHHGFVQLDPINVCGRMHDLILRNRVAGYREGDLLRHLHGPDHGPGPPLRPGLRVAVEVHAPGSGNLAVFPLEAWPYLAHAMEARAQRRGGWGGRLSRAEERLARRVLQEIEDRGPLSTDDIDHHGRTTTAWGTQGRAVKVLLEKLFLHGRVLIATRRGFRRVYDLPHRVLPARLLRAPRPSPEEAARFRAHLRIRQRRLVAARRAERPLLEGLVQEVRVDGLPPCLCLREDLPALEADRAALGGDASQAVRLLAPLDPLVYDRRLTAALFGFDYTWEVYTPPARRLRGYYALPVLCGDRLVGHLEPRADRQRGRLEILSRRVARGVGVAAAVRELAAFLGLRPARGGAEVAPPGHGPASPRGRPSQAPLP